MKFKVKAPLVSRLVRQYKADPGCFDEPTPKEQRKSAKVNAVIAQAKELLDGGGTIWRSSQLSGPASKQSGRPISDAFVAQTLREYLDLRYKKVKRVAYVGNSD